MEAAGHGSAGDGRIRIEADDYQARFASIVPFTQAVHPDSPVMI